MALNIFCCFRGCANFLDFGITTQNVPIKKVPLVSLDTQKIGKKNVVNTTINRTVCRLNGD